jgi:hypothetical protein
MRLFLLIKQLRTPFYIFAAMVILILSLKFYQISNSKTEMPDNQVSKIIKDIVHTRKSGCLNLYTDKENNFSFCLPAFYYQIPKDTPGSWGVASFSPLTNKPCVDSANSYCSILFFSYGVGNEEAPTSLMDNRIYIKGDPILTSSGEQLQTYSFEHTWGNTYSFKLKNGKYAYFNFATSHPKRAAEEYQNHLEILRSVKSLY